MSLKVVFATMAIYLTCSMIDALRIYLFKVCSIYKYCDNFSDYLEQKRWGEILSPRKIIKNGQGHATPMLWSI